ncbi:MAG: UDP-N-acetylglucosamine 2-epimerase [Burkholderiaceae bacterium]|nr:UDP-N-acetylglucosamine 2-epimerase [Burkholderiaceae bacterium]
MIICYIGTRAQLIKMAPVILEIERQKLPLVLIMTGQHRETMVQLMTDFGLTSKPVYLYEGREITGIVQMAFWFIRCCFTVLRNPVVFMPRSKDGPNIVLVHGDTFSTLLGAVLGRLLGVDVAHVEAGLRSYHIFHPFPEELTRLIVFRLSRLSFCPGDWAFGNMQGYRTQAVNTGGNTLRDALEAMLASAPPKSAPFESDYGIVSIHRFENIFNAAKLREIVGLIELAAQRFSLAFVLHPATRKKLTEFGLMESLERNAAVKLLPRMGYAEFVQLMRSARFVITDGGGNQEELSYLGIPTLLMRKATERKEGLGSTAVLCNYERAALERFMDELPTLEERKPAERGSAQTPSEMIVSHLQRYAAPA